MEQKFFHGKITSEQIAQTLTAQFNRGNFIAQQSGGGKHITVQITTRQNQASGGHTALAVTLQNMENGVSAQIGQQNWSGIAASLGKTALTAFLNPLSLLDRLDDVAQDVESIQLSLEVWKAIEGAARSLGAAHDLSDSLKQMQCQYCSTANPAGETYCVGCGAPLGMIQTITCKSCGFVVKKEDTICPNCRRYL